LSAVRRLAPALPLPAPADQVPFQEEVERGGITEDMDAFPLCRCRGSRPRRALGRVRPLEGPSASIDG